MSVKMLQNDGAAVSSAVSASLRHLVAKGTLTGAQATAVQETANTFMTALYEGKALSINPEGTVTVVNPEETNELELMEVGGHA